MLLTCNDTNDLHYESKTAARDTYDMIIKSSNLIIRQNTLSYIGLYLMSAVHQQRCYQELQL